MNKIIIVEKGGKGVEEKVKERLHASQLLPARSEFGATIIVTRSCANRVPTRSLRTARGEREPRSRYRDRSNVQ